jgi:hypothetical protein
MSIVPVLVTGKAKGKKIVPVPLDEQIYNWLKANWDKEWNDIEAKLEYQIDVWVNNKKLVKRAGSSEVPRPSSPVLSHESPMIPQPGMSDEKPVERASEKIPIPIEKPSPPIEKPSPPIEKPSPPVIVSPPMFTSPQISEQNTPHTKITESEPTTEKVGVWNTYLPPPPTAV